MSRNRSVFVEVMTPIQLAQWVVKNHSYRKWRDIINIEGNNKIEVLALEAEHGQGEYSEDEEDIPNIEKSRNKGRWILLDAITASAIVQVYNAVSVENKKKMEGHKMLKLVDVTWATINRAKAK